MYQRLFLISAAMNDPWDVKSVRLGNQYSSCMRINGVPLLPPVLSKECRKEMQYYKLLAKEVEKRISILQPYIESDCESNADRTDVPDITECDDPEYVSPLEDKLEATIDFIVDKFSPRENKNEKTHPLSTDRYNANHSGVVIDLNVQIAGDRGVYTANPRHSPVPDEIPERDCDYYKKNKKQKELLTDIETNRKRTQKELVDSIIDYELNIISDNGDYLLKDGPSSLSSKSFTGSLNDLHADISKQSQGSKLIRQRSYTVLNPSPQLLAHLEVQSMNTGVELNSISMSESMSKLSCSAKKRKSWDLETAKVKWSSMAMEMKKKNIAAKSIASSNDKNRNAKSNSLKQDKRERLQCNPNVRALKSEPVEKNRHVQNSVTNKNVSNGKGIARQTPSSTNTKVAKSSPNPVSPKKEDKNTTVALISESDDPAARVRELYEKLQKQQLKQMANLMEKQKREQNLLQQVFEEQNNILLKQLKTVCPEGSIKVKQAWGELKNDDEIDRGPVSLSQLINTSTPDHSQPNSPVSKTLTESNSCLNKCDSMLKRSRDITNSIRKQTTNVETANGGRGQRSIDQAPITHPQANPVMTKSRSPIRNTSRRLIYEATASSDADTILTDRTNDTMADLNVTFPSDNSDSYSPSNRKIYVTRACSPLRSRSKSPRKSADGGSNNLERNMTSTNSVGSRSVTKHSILYRQPNAQELVAATKIVACAKGFLVRRLMRTERVQTTVQTIKDALLCALQLHQDREGIRGADVDLHRRLIQQITAACYTLHDTFVSSSSTERCSMVAADRARRQALVNKPPSSRSSMRGDVMSQSHSGAFPSRVKRPSSAGLMTQSNYETFEKPRSRYNRYMPTQSKMPWR